MSKEQQAGRHRSGRLLLILGVIAGLGALGFGALGIWQVERLAWKNGLIAAVETRSTAAPLDLDGADWTAINPEEMVYQRVSVTGQFVGADSFVQAVTTYGGGFWAMTPLQLADGRIVLVNRGFVTAAERDSVALPVDGPETTITGLLRETEPDGGFLRSNDPAAKRWFSRDVAAIAAANDLVEVAPFFIDADRVGEGYPIGGLTVLTFTNNHLIYALTWFGLAAMLLAGFGYVLWDRFKRR